MERWLAYVYRGLPEYYTYDGPDAIADELILRLVGKRKDLKPFNIKKRNWTADTILRQLLIGILILNISVPLICLSNIPPAGGCTAEEVDFMKAECRFFIAYYNSMMAIA